MELLLAFYVLFNSESAQKRNSWTTRKKKNTIKRNNWKEYSVDWSSQWDFWERVIFSLILINSMLWEEIVEDSSLDRDSKESKNPQVWIFKKWKLMWLEDMKRIGNAGRGYIIQPLLFLQTIYRFYCKLETLKNYK